MLKKPLFLLALLVLFPLALADVLMISPFEKTLSVGDVVELGSIAPGESFELIFSDESLLGQEIMWSKASVKQSSLPAAWTAIDSEEGKKRLVVLVSVPAAAKPNVYQFKVALSNDDFQLSEEITAKIDVKKGLIKAVIDEAELNQSPMVNEKVKFNIVLTNSSISDHRVKVKSTLPFNWFEEKEFIVPAKQVVEQQLLVAPRVFGRKAFSFSVVSELNGEHISSFDSVLSVKPTLKGKFASSISGFPFFTVTLLPYHFFNALFSLFFV